MLLCKHIQARALKCCTIKTTKSTQYELTYITYFNFQLTIIKEKHENGKKKTTAATTATRTTRTISATTKIINQTF